MNLTYFNETVSEDAEVFTCAYPPIADGGYPLTRPTLKGDGHPCVFPFTFNGNVYQKCLSVYATATQPFVIPNNPDELIPPLNGGNPGFWCPIVAVINSGDGTKKMWGYCNCPKSGAPTPAPISVSSPVPPPTFVHDPSITVDQSLRTLAPTGELVRDRSEIVQFDQNTLFIFGIVITSLGAFAFFALFVIFAICKLPRLIKNRCHPDDDNNGSSTTLTVYHAGGTVASHRGRGESRAHSVASNYRERKTTITHEVIDGVEIYDKFEEIDKDDNSFMNATNTSLPDPPPPPTPTPPPPEDDGLQKGVVVDVIAMVQEKESTGRITPNKRQGSTIRQSTIPPAPASQPDFTPEPERKRTFVPVLNAGNSGPRQSLAQQGSATRSTLVTASPFLQQQAQPQPRGSQAQRGTVPKWKPPPPPAQAAKPTPPRNSQISKPNPISANPMFQRAQNPPSSGNTESRSKRPSLIALQNAAAEGTTAKGGIAQKLEGMLQASKGGGAKPSSTNDGGSGPSAPPPPAPKPLSSAATANLAAQLASKPHGAGGGAKKAFTEADMAKFGKMKKIGLADDAIRHAIIREGLDPDEFFNNV